MVVGRKVCERHNDGNSDVASIHNDTTGCHDRGGPCVRIEGEDLCWEECAVVHCEDIHHLLVFADQNSFALLSNGLHH